MTKEISTGRKNREKALGWTRCSLEQEGKDVAKKIDKSLFLRGSGFDVEDDRTEANESTRR